MDKCVENASAVEVCQFGDSRLLEETSKVFKKEKNLKKGKYLLSLLYNDLNYCSKFCFKKVSHSQHAFQLITVFAIFRHLKAILIIPSKTVI
jgi:hypothetical protein